jgi:hypothetical protein
MRSLKEKSIALWKVAPTLIRPNDILKYIIVPHAMVNTVLSWSSLLRKTWLYPKNPSNMDIIPSKPFVTNVPYLGGDSCPSRIIGLGFRNQHTNIYHYFSSGKLPNLTSMMST